MLSSPFQLYYRLYCLNEGGRIVGVEEAHCDDDASACEHARSRLPDMGKCHTIEVWNHARRVGQVSRQEA